MKLGKKCCCRGPGNEMKDYSWKEESESETKHKVVVSWFQLDDFSCGAKKQLLAMRKLSCSCMLLWSSLQALRSYKAPSNHNLSLLLSLFGITASTFTCSALSPLILLPVASNHMPS